MENDMTNIPVLPIAGATLARASFGLLAQLKRWGTIVARVARHRREARLLAGLDRHMLADIGLTRSDVNDAFSSPIWEDPTALLRERVKDRQLHRPMPSHNARLHVVQPGFRQPPANRPSRQTV
jgi:uncharacterized protein YjiS (DUF1127 family)